MRFSKSMNAPQHDSGCEARVGRLEPPYTWKKMTSLPGRANAHLSALVAYCSAPRLESSPLPAPAQPLRSCQLRHVPAQRRQSCSAHPHTCSTRANSPGRDAGKHHPKHVATAVSSVSTVAATADSAAPTVATTPYGNAGAIDTITTANDAAPTSPPASATVAGAAASMTTIASTVRASVGGCGVCGGAAA